MMTTIIHTLTIAMTSPYSADVSLHLERCKNPVVNVQPIKPIVTLQCENYRLTVDCSEKKKTNIKSLFDGENMYLGHIECRRSK